MEHWLDDNEVDELVRELNPELLKGNEYDANWELLKKERTNPFDNTQKIQTPTLYLFETTVGFSYRRFDGAHWHTEWRNIRDGRGFTSEQRELKDSLDTLLALTHKPKLKWITPTLDDGTLDPKYQILNHLDTWYCLINGSVYKESNRRIPSGKNHTEVTFSTRNKPQFDLTQVNDILNELLPK